MTTMSELTTKKRFSKNIKILKILPIKYLQEAKMQGSIITDPCIFLL